MIAVLNLRDFSLTPFVAGTVTPFVAGTVTPFVAGTVTPFVAGTVKINLRSLNTSDTNSN